MTIRVLFICLGNICRSPMAEGVFQALVDEAGLSDEILVDSVGTAAYHVGERAHPGTRKVLAEHGIAYNGRSRQISPTDINNSNSYLVAMDSSNLRDINGRFNTPPNLSRLLDYATQTSQHDVPDPYYVDTFENVYRLIEDGCRGLLQHIRSSENML